MKNKTLLRKGNEFVRVLKTNDENVLVIDCVKREMPKWVSVESLKDFSSCEESELLEHLNVSFADEREISDRRRKTMNERYMMLQGIIALVGNSKLRSEAIVLAESEYKVGKQTIRHYLCEYLAFDDVRSLLPRERVEKELSADEKNMRWALNKFYYNINKNTLKNAYTMMLKEKYCNGNGRLLEHYPTYHQFRYYFRKTKDLQKLHITREGLVAYQRNNRPLLGDGVTEFAPCIGTAMLDSTVCDIYLVNEANQIVGRPLLSACVDVYSGICMGYSLTWEGGVYSLRNVSSTGTVSELPHGEKMKEPTEFNLDDIVGYYGKTKAMATQLVFDAVKEKGLKATVVYPTGICGPNDYAGGPVSTFIEQYCNGGNKIGFPGSFNSVDVRDLAFGTIAAVDRGRIGEGYILGNDVVWMKDMFSHISHASGVSMTSIILPMFLTRIVVKISVMIGKITKKEPLITELMLYNLVRNNDFDSSKAKKELGYKTRPFEETIYDEVEWLKSEKRIK